MPRECFQLLPCVNIPQTDRVVLTRACERISIRAKRYAIDRRRMPVSVFSCCSMSTSHRWIVSSSQPPMLAIVCPLGLNDTLLDPICMPDECCFQVPPCSNVPQTDGTVLTRACDCLSIGTKRYAIDITRMPRECFQLLPYVNIPQTDRVAIQLPVLAIVCPSGLNTTL